MTRLHRTATAALVLVPLAAGLVAGTAAASDGSARRPDPERARVPDPVEVTAGIASFEFVDVNAPGITAGDYFIQTDTLVVDGQDQGTDILRCTATGDEQHPGICDAALVLEDGTITVAGRLPRFEPEDGLAFVLSITGGTGAYAGATGEASAIETAAGYEATLTFTR